MNGQYSPWRFCVAPMMDWTDRHCRHFHRSMTRRARLYTEMITTGAVIHGERERLLGFSTAEQPVALQLGGSDPAALGECAKIGEQFGYAEINLNIGCPSDRVQNGRFGACLMAEPELVAACVAAMKRAVTIPVSVKCRIGIDAQDSEASLDEFALRVIGAGADALIVHARKAWLKGLSPRENRDIPPLNYERVYRLKKKFPDVPIILNGGMHTLEEVKAHLDKVSLPLKGGGSGWGSSRKPETGTQNPDSDFRFPASGFQLDGAMMGRAAYHEPWKLLRADSVLFGEADRFENAFEVARAMEPYLAEHLARGVRLSSMTRHMLTLFHAIPGTRMFRRVLAEESVKPGAGLEVWRKALAALKRDQVQAESLAAA